MAHEDSPVAPTTADFRILEILVENAGRVISRETLSRVAGLDGATARRADVSLVALRRALGADSIRTVRQRGWILTDDGLAAAKKLLGHQIDIQP